MVSGFLISPKDQDLIRSGEAIEIWILSKLWAAFGWPNGFIKSFMLRNS